MGSVEIVDCVTDSASHWFVGRYGFVLREASALPFIARKTSSNPDAYVYLAESIRAWPNQTGLAEHITSAGWQNVGWQNLTGGVVAVHSAVAP